MHSAMLKYSASGVHKPSYQPTRGDSRNSDRDKSLKVPEVKLPYQKTLKIDKWQEEVNKIFKRPNVKVRIVQNQSERKVHTDGNKPSGVYKYLSQLIKQRVKLKVNPAKAELSECISASETNHNLAGNVALLSKNLVNMSFHYPGPRAEIKHPCGISTERDFKQLKNERARMVPVKAGKGYVNSESSSSTSSVACQCPSQKPVESSRGNTLEEGKPEQSNFPSTISAVDLSCRGIVKMSHPKTDTVCVRSSSNDLLNVITIDDYRLAIGYRSQRNTEEDFSHYFPDGEESKRERASNQDSVVFQRRCCVTPCREPVVPAVHGVVPIRSCVDKALSVARANKQSCDSKIVFGHTRPKSAPAGYKRSKTFSRLNSGLRKHVSAVLSAKATLSLLPAMEKRQALDILESGNDPTVQRESLHQLFQDSVEKRLNAAATLYTEKRLVNT